MTNSKLPSLVLVALFALSLTAPDRSHAQPFCHGAVGVQCGNWFAFQIAACMPNPANVARVLCLVNTGSWRHDECCARPGPGVMCSGGGEQTTACSAEWARAHHRTTNGYSWWRSLNPSFADSTPLTIDRPLYCAPSNAKIHRNDTPSSLFCCSGRSRGPDFFEALIDPNMRRCL